MCPAVGIGITTYNRRESALYSIGQVCKVAPPGAKIVVVDDCSDFEFKTMGVEVHRNSTRRGVAYSKNKCLELLDDCDYIFLLDDDIFPIAHGWTDRYIEASLNTGIQHFQYCWKYFHSERSINSYRYNEFKKGAGVMLFFTRKAIETVGGYDLRYGLWGYEHLGMSYRIYNHGLAPTPFNDVIGSGDLFFAYDKDGKDLSVVSHEVKKQVRNAPLLVQEKTSTEYKPYKPGDFVLGVYLTSKVDIQRGYKWEPKISDVQDWADSLARHEMTGVLFVDELEIQSSPWLKIIRVDPGSFSCTACNHRWELYKRWLEISPEYQRNIWATDVTDCVMLNKPVPKGHVLYCGDEEKTIACKWALKRFNNNPEYVQMVLDNPNRKLLNCGVVGGDPEKFYYLCWLMVEDLKLEDPVNTDMISFNAMVKNFNPISGRQVTTVFKKFEKESSAWWRHK